MKKRIISAFLALAMCLILFPAQAIEQGNTQPCPHHPEHTNDCGYVQSVQAQPCTHTHGENCYVLFCAHEHDDICGYTEESEEQLCTHEHGELCFVLVCDHVHDEACGYAEAAEGHPCEFVCNICNSSNDVKTEQGESEASADGNDPDFVYPSKAEKEQPVLFLPYILDEKGQNQPTAGTSGHVSDDNTMNDYKEVLDLYTNSRYAGRLWSDKSVIPTGLTVNGTEIKNDSDFLHIFSALGSSLKTSGVNQLPLDVVFILDTSYSMVSESEALYGGKLNNNRLESACTALNTAMSMVMQQNPNNRVGLVEFNSDSYEVMSLGRYLPNTAGDYFTYVSYDPIGTYGRISGINITSTVEAGSGGKIEGERRVQVNSALNSRTFDARLTPLCPNAALGYDTGYRYGMTNTQAGLYTGMSMLANVEKSDTSVVFHGEVLQRIPVVIMISDGQPTRAMNNGNWWEKGDPIGTLGSNSVYGTGILTLATANYMQRAINRKYFGSSNGNVAANAFFRTRVYTFGLETNLLRNDDKSLSQAVLDPSKGTLGAEAAANEAAVRGTIIGNIRTAWQTYNSKAATEVAIGGGNNITMQHPAEEYDIIGDADAATALDYVEEYIEVGNASDLPTEFARIIKHLTETAPWIPVAGDNDVQETDKDALTYIDPIGKYMEVKDVKYLLLLNQLYQVVKDGEEVSGEGGSIIQNYTIVDSDPNATPDDLHWNPIYGEEPEVLSEEMPGVYKLSDFKIYVKTTGDYEDPGVGNVETDAGFDQALYFNIPASALPIWVASYSEENGEPKSYTVEEANPLRLFYTVGMAKAVLYDTDGDGVGDGKVDLTKVDANYLYTHKDPNNAQVYFYSNWYANKDYGDYILYESVSSGDPVVSFSPAPNNRYYIFQKNLRVYGPVKDFDEAKYKANPEDFEHLIDANPNAFADSISWNGTTINAATDINSNDWYYIVIEYYSERGLQKLAVPRKGSMFGSGIGSGTQGAYLCWYNPTTGVEANYMVDGKPQSKPAGDGWTIATKKGAVRTGNMSRNIQAKESRITYENGAVDQHTAGTYYLPTISSKTGDNPDSTVINNYMGNNARLEVTDTQLVVTKTTQGSDPKLENEGGSPSEFVFTVTLKDETGAPLYGEQDISAIRMIRHPGEGVDKWRALFESIDLFTDGQGFLLDDADGEPAVYTEEDGTTYYIRVSGISEDSECIYPLFDSKEGTLPDQIKMPTSVQLVAVRDDGSPDFDRIKDLAELTVGRINWDAAVGHEAELRYTDPAGKTVHLRSRSNYMTETLHFNEKGECSFSLTDGTGLVFNNLDKNVRYTVQETITKAQREDDWRFVGVKTRISGEDAHDHSARGENEITKDETKEDYTYSVSDVTYGSKSNKHSITSEEHFYNENPDFGELKIEKVVTPVFSDTFDHGFTFEVKLTLPEKYDEENDDNLLSEFEYEYYILEEAEGSGVTLPEQSSGNLVIDNWAKNKDGHYVGSGTVTLFHGMGIHIKGLPIGAEYLITEAEDREYVLQEMTGEQGTIAVSTPENVAKAHFINGRLIDMPAAGGIGARDVVMLGCLLLLAATALMLYGWNPNKKRL